MASFTSFRALGSTPQECEVATLKAINICQGFHAREAITLYYNHGTFHYKGTKGRAGILLKARNPMVVKSGAASSMPTCPAWLPTAKAGLVPHHGSVALAKGKHNPQGETWPMWG